MDIVMNSSATTAITIVNIVSKNKTTSSPFNVLISSTQKANKEELQDSFMEAENVGEVIITSYGTARSHEYVLEVAIPSIRDEPSGSTLGERNRPGQLSPMKVSDATLVQTSYHPTALEPVLDDFNPTQSTVMMVANLTVTRTGDKSASMAAIL